MILDTVGSFCEYSRFSMFEFADFFLKSLTYLVGNFEVSLIFGSFKGFSSAVTQCHNLRLMYSSIKRVNGHFER